ncbi:hypothetical protein FOL47_007793 [Perkinsus chesapeaki]|uniref:SS18 N-terminal domain-containing protein n=1 Tax=Perkinsus chesapeaki TaxID=330153 RepID=A0A7J6LHW3_PERCH|nr:hypothetical protein FOL47_007793 [Perkinsus chesapeaki]
MDNVPLTTASSSQQQRSALNTVSGIAADGVPRGPAQLPCHVTGPESLKRMLDENDVIIEMLKELQTDRCPVERRVPLLSRLQRNLLYLALLADQNTSAGDPTTGGQQQQQEIKALQMGVSRGAVSAHRFSVAAPPTKVSDWTPDEVLKLQESMRQQQAAVPPGATVVYDVMKLTDSLGGSKTLAEVRALIESIQPASDSTASKGV